MKRSAIISVLLAVCIIVTGCKKDKVMNNNEKPAITIWEVKPSSHGVEFMLTPVSAAYYQYIVVMAAAQSGTEFISVNSTVTATLVVDGLVPDTEYVIKAEAVNGAGEIARNQYTFVTDPSPLAYAAVENLVVFHNRIDFDVVTTDCRTILYAVAPASDEQSLVQFNSVQATGETVSLQIGQLSENTGYKLYIYPVNADGEKGDLVVQAFRTPRNVVEVAVASVDELSASATFTLSLTGVSTLYYCHTLRGAPQPGEQDYSQKVIDNNAQTTTVTIDGLTRGNLYTAYFYGTNQEGVSGAVVSSNFEAADNSINLSLDATANSYICTALTEYKFNASVRGNSTQSVGTPAGAKLLWTDKANIINSVTLDEQSVRFVLAGYGNGVIAVTDAQDKILWSWHIYAPEEAIADERCVNHHGATYYVMDRNLGAMKSRSGMDCLLYQWGRKDPFPNVHTAFRDGTGTAATFVTLWPPVDYASTGANTEANIAYSIANPATFISSATTGGTNDQSWMMMPDMTLWGDDAGFGAIYNNGNWSGDKSIYDPCPAGYRVANYNTFSGFTITGANSSNAAEFNVINSDWGTGATGHWFFRRYAGDTQGTYWPNTGSRDPITGIVARGTQAEHFFSNTTGSTGTRARYMQVHATAVGVVSSSITAYGHALRCVRYKSETQTNSSDYTHP